MKNGAHHGSCLTPPSLGYLDAEFLADLAVDFLDLFNVTLQFLPGLLLLGERILEMRYVALAHGDGLRLRLLIRRVHRLHLRPLLVISVPVLLQSAPVARRHRALDLSQLAISSIFLH